MDNGKIVAQIDDSTFIYESEGYGLQPKRKFLYIRKELYDKAGKSGFAFVSLTKNIPSRVPSISMSKSKWKDLDLEERASRVLESLDEDGFTEVWRTTTTQKFDDFLSNE